MERIEEYALVTSIYIDNINKNVNLKISEGWQPYGNLVVIKDPKSGDSATYTQPMVKYVADLIQNNTQILNS